MLWQPLAVENFPLADPRRLSSEYLCLYSVLAGAMNGLLGAGIFWFGHCIKAAIFVIWLGGFLILVRNQ